MKQLIFIAIAAIFAAGTFQACNASDAQIQPTAAELNSYTNSYNMVIAAHTAVDSLLANK